MDRGKTLSPEILKVAAFNLMNYEGLGPLRWPGNKMDKTKDERERGLKMLEII